MRAPYVRGLFQRMISLGFGLLLLAGCDRYEAPTAVAPEPTLERVSVTGYAVNGPLEGATVRIFGADGRQLGSATTGADGAYHAQVSVSPPYRIEVVGGRLDGEPYHGVLRALCETATDCNITPFTTIVVRLMDEHGYNAGDARARLAQRVNFDYDPFARSLIDAMPVDEFDLDRARTYLDGGEALDEWLDVMLTWIDQPMPGEDPPAGIRYYYTVTANAGEGGAITPATQNVVHGQTASFTVTPASGYGLDTVSGCGGSLSDNTYTTAAITGDCAVSAAFTLDLAAPALNTSVGSGEVTVNWAPVTDAEGYDLYYAEESFDPANYNSYAGGTLLADVSSPRTVSGLSNGTEYFFSAAAKAGSARRFSALVSATPMAACFGIQADDPQVCGGNGSCPATDACECAAGFIGEQCDVELNFSDGSREHYFPTTTGRYHIIDGPDLPAGETYVWKFEILATGYWPGREGFNVGVAGYPLAAPTFHELGQSTDEWAYRGGDGRTYAEGVDLTFGRVWRNIGEQIMLELDTVTGVLNIYTKRVGDSEFTLEGGGPALTDVFPEEGRVLRPAVSGICWQPCGIRFID